MSADVRRRVPSVDSLLRSEPGRRAATTLGRPLLKRTLAAVLDGVRRAAAGGSPPPSNDEILARAVQRASWAKTGLEPVINATGVVLHTNLGRAPLHPEAVQRVAEIASGYSNLEIDLRGGRRGHRSAHVEPLLCELFGAEAAHVVNNCAGATLLALSAISRSAIVSRGELVEIGGGFRVPEIMQQSGCTLHEVGTTNRTRIADYAAALAKLEKADILRVHRSNFALTGFTETPSVAELAKLAKEHGVRRLDRMPSSRYE